MLKYTLSAGHPQLGGVDLDLAVEDDVFHSIRLTRMDDEFGSNGKSSVAAICEISQACRLTMKARISVPGSGAGGKRWHPKQARFCPEETHVCSGHFGLTCDISDSDVINGVCHFQRRTLTVYFCTNLASTLIEKRCGRLPLGPEWQRIQWVEHQPPYLDLTTGLVIPAAIGIGETGERR